MIAVDAYWANTCIAEVAGDRVNILKGAGREMWGRGGGGLMVAVDAY